MNRTATLALGLVEVVLGYEWLSSALTKLVRGDFPSGLAHELRDRAHGRYGAFLRDVVIPHATVFGWSIQVGEVFVALLLFVGAACAFADRYRSVGLAATGFGALTGCLLTANFGLSDGAHFFSVVASDSFDEAVPLDVLATWLQLALVAAALAALVPRAGRLGRG
jgi:uncharacterized membrane protein YphA (DoxX/SURF4 family)